MTGKSHFLQSPRPIGLKYLFYSQMMKDVIILLYLWLLDQVILLKYCKKVALHLRFLLNICLHNYTMKITDIIFSM